MNVNDGGLRAGTTTFGKYELFAKLGSGGMADVFLALSRGMAGFNKLVVLKRLRRPLADDGAMVAMFLDEARLTARLHHPNIVNTYEVGEHGGEYFIAMEYLEGQALDRVLKHPRARELITPAMWCLVFCDTLAGLHHAHQQCDFDGKPLDIVHRDLSPHNVFVTYAGVAKVVDFGIAKTSINSTATEVGVLKGKINYMAPEQVRGDCDRRADLFAVGLALWEALAGRGVYRGDAITVLQRILHDPVPSLLEASPDIDPALAAIVMKAVEKERDARYATALEFRHALDGYLRSTGQTLHDGAVGLAVSTLFAEVKETVASRVRECVAGLSLGAAAVAPVTMADRIRVPPRTENAPNAPIRHYPDSAGEAKLSAAPVTASSPPTAQTVTEVVAREPSQLPRGWRLAKVTVVVLTAAALGAAGVGFVQPNRSSLAADGSPGTVKVSVDSAPQGAAIERDGRLVGYTPAVLEVPLGRQSLRIVKDGFAAQAVIVDVAGPMEVPGFALVAVGEPAPSAPTTTAVPHIVASAKPPTVSWPVVRLRPAPQKPGPLPAAEAAPTVTPVEIGYLSFATSPWTRVSEGGRVLGTTPLSRVPLSAGTHVLFLDNADEGLHTTYTVVIKPGESSNRNVALK